MRGCITKRSKNSYSISIYLGKDNNGKKKYKWYTVNGNKREAERFLNEKINELNNGILVLNDKMYIKNFLEFWYNEYCIVQLAVTTYESYKRNIDKYINPYIGNIKLIELKPLQLQSLYNELLKKLSKKTVLYIHRIIHKALNQALKWQLVIRNVADCVVAPKPDNYKSTVLDDKEITQLLKTTKNTEIYIPVLIAVGTGLRRGEILGLTWDNIDFENKTLTVEKSLVPTKNKLQLTTPKTEKSKRTIYISDTIIKELKELKYNQNLIKKFLKENYLDNNLIVCKTNGDFYSPTKLNHTFRKILIEYNLPLIRFHDLRHTHASLLLKENVNAKLISERLGHSNISTTMNIYSHTYNSSNKEIAETFNKFLKAN